MKWIKDNGKWIMVGLILTFSIINSQFSMALAQKCATQMNNVAGDIIDSYTNWWDQGEGGFSWETYINGVQFEDYGAERLPSDGPCMNFCTPFRFVAKTANVNIALNVVSGNASGWKCDQVSYVVGHINDQPRFDLVAISPEAKDRAKVWSLGAQSALVYLDPLIALYALSCAGSAEADVCAMAILLVTFKRGLEISKNWADAWVRDPFDENYLYPYDPPLYDPVSQLGLPQCASDGSWIGDAFCRWNNEHTRYIYSDWEGAYISANRAASCAQVGNENCFWMHKERVRSFIQAAGVHTEYLVYGLVVLSDATGFQQTRTAAAELYPVALEMQQCSQC